MSKWTNVSLVTAKIGPMCLEWQYILIWGKLHYLH
jgi:hypothetical protein